MYAFIAQRMLKEEVHFFTASCNRQVFTTKTLKKIRGVVSKKKKRNMLS